MVTRVYSTPLTIFLTRTQCVTLGAFHEMAQVIELSRTQEQTKASEAAAKTAEMQALAVGAVYTSNAVGPIA
jgi:hypothetical protein